MEDDLIIRLYWDRNEQAITETKNKYGRYCAEICHQILHNREDEEECINDLILRVWNTIPPQRPQNFKAFLAKIIRNISIDQYRKQHTQKREASAYLQSLEELDRDHPSVRSVGREYEMKEMTQAMEAFLKALPLPERRIFLKRYWYFEDIDTIAQQENVNGQRVRHVLYKVRKNLKKYLSESEMIP